MKSLFFPALYLYSVILLPAPLQAQVKTLDANQISTEAIELKEYVLILEDRSKSLSYTDILKPEIREKFLSANPDDRTLNFGITDSIYWLKFHVSNNSSRPIDLMIEITYPRLTSVILHHSITDREIRLQKSGYRIPFKEKPYQHRYIVFPVSIAAKSNSLFCLQVNSLNTIELPLRVWTKEAFHKYERIDYTWQAIYFGIAIAMIIFNLLLFLSLHDTNYFIYLIFAVCGCLTIASINGLGTEFLWGTRPQTEKIAHLFFSSLSLGFLLVFMQRMISIPEFTPRLDAIIRIFSYFQFAMAFALLVVFNSHTIKLSLLLDLAAIILIFCTSLFFAWKGQRIAIIFFGSYIAFILCAMSTALWAVGVVSNNLFIRNALQIGSGSEMLLLAFALADKFNTIRKEQERLLIQLQQERMNPHYLFNSVNMIFGLIRKHPHKAERALILLSDTYRFLTDFGNKLLIPLAKEWEFLKNYLELMEIRFGSQISINIKQFGVITGLKIPPLIFQPVIENAIKHGFTRNRKKLTIEIILKTSGSGLEFQCTDNGKQITEEQAESQRSIQNIRKRLTYFFQVANVTLQNSSPDGVIVEIKLDKYRSSRVIDTLQRL